MRPPELQIRVIIRKVSIHDAVLALLITSIRERVFVQISVFSPVLLLLLCLLFVKELEASRTVRAKATMREG
jgi:hypothetical protein